MIIKEDGKVLVLKNEENINTVRHNLIGDASKIWDFIYTVCKNQYFKEPCFKDYEFELREHSLCSVYRSSNDVEVVVSVNQTFTENSKYHTLKLMIKDNSVSDNEWIQVDPDEAIEYARMFFTDEVLLGYFELENERKEKLEEEKRKQFEIEFNRRKINKDLMLKFVGGV